MDFLGRDYPIIQYLFSNIDNTVVVLLNRVGQLICIISGMQALYETKIHKFLAGHLDRFGSLHNRFQLYIGKRGFVLHFFTNESRVIKGLKFTQISFGTYILLSCILTFFLLYSKHNLLYWFYYPFTQIYNGLRIWFFVSIDFYSITSTALKSIFFLLFWSWISLFLAFFGLFIFAKTSLLFLECMSRILSKKAYRFSIAMEFLLGGIIVLITS